jgi:hypothetical protein
VVEVAPQGKVADIGSDEAFVHQEHARVEQFPGIEALERGECDFASQLVEGEGVSVSLM